MRRLVSFCVAALVSAFVMFATPSEAEATVPLSLGGYAAQLEAPIVGTSPMIQNPVLAQTGAPDLNGLYADQFHRAQTWARIGTYTAFGGLILATVGLFMAIDCIGLFTDDATDSCGAGLGLFWGGSLLALAGSVTVGSAGFRAGRRLSLMGGNGNTVMPIVSLVMVVTALVLPSVVGVGSGTSLGRRNHRWRARCRVEQSALLSSRFRRAIRQPPSAIRGGAVGSVVRWWRRGAPGRLLDDRRPLVPSGAARVDHPRPSRYEALIP